MKDKKKILEVDDCDLEEIARLVKEGYTSGRKDSEGKHISFEIKINVW